MGISAVRTFVRPAAIVALFGIFTLAGCGELFTGDDDATDKKNWAVIVGISSYQSSALNLKWAEEDALDFYDALRSSRGWESDNITLLTNGSATKDAIKAALAGLAKRVGADDRVVFYYSGRGSYGPDQPPFDEGDGLEEYLVPFDGATASPAQDLSDDAIEALLAALPTNNVLVLLDAGFTGITSRAGIPSERAKCLLRAGSGKTVAPQSVDGMSHELARPGYIFISAAQNGVAPGESSQLRNGVFTHYFVEGLRGAANPSSKKTSAQQAFGYAAPRTSAYEAGQSPQLIDNTSKNVPAVTLVARH
jgi:uncharacterized caspase-like protein